MRREEIVVLKSLQKENARLKKLVANRRNGCAERFIRPLKEPVIWTARIEIVGSHGHVSDLWWRRPRARRETRRRRSDPSVTGSPRTGPLDVRLTRPERAGGESHEEDQAHARAGDPQAARCRADARRSKGLLRSVGPWRSPPQTFHRWQKQFQGIRRGEVVELRNLRKANARLKKLVTNQALDIDMLKDVARGNW